MGLPLVAHPVGWIILGGAGYIAYKTGKKSGMKTEEDRTKTNLSDRVVKGTMKAAYKAQKGICEGLDKAKEKCGTLWTEAKTEADTTSDKA